MSANVYAFTVSRKRLRAADSGTLVKLDNAEKVAALHRVAVGQHSHRECFVAYYVDSKNEVIGYELIAIGGACEVHVTPSEVFRGALIAGARALIVAHNHPSGDATPSTADDDLTERLRAAGELIGLPVRRPRGRDGDGKLFVLRCGEV